MIWLETIKAMNINSKNKDHFLQMNAFFFPSRARVRTQGLGHVETTKANKMCPVGAGAVA